ncbi:MAG: hypothetical protein O3A87_12750 [Verrucomicrobia bacterium]|nr:hypothetical protein [Verrucomicrobiota bacterium]
MKSNPIRRGLPVLAFAALAPSAMVAISQAAPVVTVEAYDTTANPTSAWGHFTTIPNLSALDYADASQGNATFNPSKWTRERVRMARG